MRGQAVRFLLAGGVNTAITYAIYYGLMATLDYRLAYSLAFAAGILISFYLNALFVFRAAPTWRKLFLYPAVYIVQYCVGILVLWIAVERLAVPKPLAMLIVIGTSIPLTFVLTRSILSNRAHVR